MKLLTPFQFKVLNLLANKKRQHPAQIAIALWGLKKVPGSLWNPSGIANGHLRKLERQNLVRFRRDEYGRGCWSITERGSIMLVNELTLQLEEKR